MLQLRPYQVELRDRARAALARGVRRILIQSATGSGKTCLVATMLAGAAARNKRAWFCVHRKELLEQSVQTFVEAADLETGIIAAGYRPTPNALVQVCSVPSLKRRALSVDPPDLLVIDECHHTASASWNAVTRMFPRAVHIGLTATPQRLDGRGLAPHFDELICGPSTAELIAAGFLSHYSLFAPPNAVNLPNVHRTAGDFDKREVAAEMEASTVVGDAVSHYRQHCPNARALAFVWSLEASKRIAAQFMAAGIEAAHVDGGTPRHERAEAMRRFRDGSIRVLCNVDLFGEGLDVPAVDAIFLLRPTQSLGLYLQQVGRGLRPAPGKASVKIFDHVNNWERHGLPDDPREWSLAGREKKSRDSSAMGRRCEKCFGVSPIGCTVCRYCGHVFPVQAREIEQVEGTLKQANLDELRQMRANVHTLAKECKTIFDLKKLARKLKYKEGWAWHTIFARHRKEEEDYKRQRKNLTERRDENMV